MTYQRLSAERRMGDEAMRLAGKIAIVTGGANGIGRATTLLFAHEGASVVVADRDATAGQECMQAIADHGGTALFVETDVSSDRAVEDLVEIGVTRFGGVDVLVNCAGVDVLASVVDTEPERWHRVMDVNLASVYRSCRAAIPHMIRRGGGSIINVASLQGMFGYPHYAAYAASKAGIIGLTRQVAVDYAALNIRSNAISPGAIETGLGENSARLEPDLAGDPAPLSGQTEEPTPVTRDARLRAAGRAEDVAYAALYLASDEARHISAHNLVVDGGASAYVG